jgi:ribonuclease HII
MKKALFHLLQSTDIIPDIIVIDAMPLLLNNSPYSSIPLESWIKGESKSASIAAASIIAKVTRDRILQKMHKSFPLYGLQKHKGYGTSAHIAALKQGQACVIHRKTFIKNFKGSNHDSQNQQNLF